MPFINWSQEFVTNIEEVDNQHKKLVSLINELYDAMKIGKGKAIISHTLKELIDYTVYHFSTEEKLMSKNSYPGFSQHKSEHDDLTRQVSELNQRFLNGEIAITVDVLNFLKTWLAQHILGSDLKFARFIAEKQA